MITATDQGGRDATQLADRSQDTKISPASNQRQQRRFKTSDRLKINRSSRSTASRLNEISVKHESQQVKLRTRRLTVCLLLLVGSISSLTPFLTLHLTNRVGLLLFESDILQLRSSLISVFICFTFLVILDLIIILFSKARTLNQDAKKSTINYLFSLDRRRSLLLQKLLKQCIGLLAITSVLAYLSLALIVPHIHQLQRTPFATFDCNANLITIENCQQQFATDTGENSLLENVQQLLVGDLNGNGGRLAKRLECLKYNDENLERLRVPTRFLLSKCGLICEPQRQQLHQFGDDLNSNLGGIGHARQLTAPYSQYDHDQPSSYNNSQSTEDSANLSAESQLVSLKLCFSGEINGEGSGGSNYLRFCIENLTGGNSGGESHQNHQKIDPDELGFSQQYPTRDQTLTVGQLNALLSHRQQSSQKHGHQASATSFDHQQPPGARGDQSTHYVNPIVQFESHFKNWPHLTRASTAFTSNNAEGAGYFPSEKSAENDSAGNTRAAAKSSSWCKFKPMPPFIVNNKPFSDIHCSLEHDYLMSTGSPLLVEASQRRHRRRSSIPKIYLRKPSSPNEFSHDERCNIGCQVNILYQVIRHRKEADSDDRSAKTNRLTTSFMPATSYYLPLKSCLVVRGDKDRTTQYYLWFRAIADASLLLTFILVDTLLMLESIDTKQFQLEGKKVRLLGLLLAITLLPQLVASLFDLTASWLPVSGGAPGRSEGQLVQFINDRLIPSMSETFAKLESYLKPPLKQQQQHQRVVHHTHEDLNSTLADHVTRERTQDQIIVDNYLVPFFIYAVLMFAFAINSFKLPLVASTSPLVRVTSTEELGMVNSEVKPTPSRSPTARQFASSKSRSLDLLSEPQRKQNLQSSECSENAPTQFARTSIKRNVPRSNWPAEEKSNSSQPKSNRHVVLFAMLTLFMGLQFNLSQITQTQILIETFNIQSDLTQQQHQQHQQQLHQSHHHYERTGRPAAVSFVLVANSCGTIFILILALLFSDELSIFLAQLFPFKPISRVPDCENNLGRREHSLRFKIFITISLVVYALRYFVLANMTAQMSKMKWLLAILFQSTELLNFPLTWFELASRSHEMLLINQQQRQQQQQSRGQKQLDGNVETRQNQQAQTIGGNTLHLLVQSSLAFVYFALARLLALFVHSLHAGLYLHSDNVDWFIESFYGSDATAAAPHSGKPAMNGKQQPNADNGTTSTTNMMDSLFIPLPSERQTYLHASRSFIRYNSLICLALALGFLIVYCHERYKLWIDRKQLELVRRRAQSPSERESDLIDERLSMDLMQIHSRRPAREGDNDDDDDKAALDGHHLRRHRSETTVFTHAPRSSLAVRRHHAAPDPTATDDESERPRARIHFRYDLGLRRNAETSSSSNSSSSSAGAYYPGNRVQRHSRRLAASKRVKHAPPRASNESRIIPMILEEEPQAQLVSSAEEEVEQFTRTRTARMLVEDEEEWSLDDGGEGDELERRATKDRQFVDSAALAAARSPPPPGFADDDNNDNSPTFVLNPPPEFDGPPLPPDERTSRAPATRTLPLASELLQQQQQQQKRRITFGPTTTFFSRGGGSGESGDQYSSASSTTMATTPSARQQHSDITVRDNRLGARGQRHLQTSSRTLVSPEPSIDDDNDEHDYEHSNNQEETTRDNNYRRETSLRTSSVPRTTLGGRSDGRYLHDHSPSGRGALDDADSIDE